MTDLSYAAIPPQLDAAAERDFQFWVEHGPDRQYGGFYGTLDRRGNPQDPTHKGLLQQSRHLWTLAMWFDRRDASPAIRALAESQYRFLIDSFRDSDGEFFFSVHRDGSPQERSKVGYAEAFALYALAHYGMVFGDASAIAAGIDCFRAYDARAHCTEYPGYDQSQEGTPKLRFLHNGGSKELGTHLHLIEAFAALYRATGDAVVGERLRELVDAYCSDIPDADGLLRFEYHADWTPAGPARMLYGHDVKTVWFLWDAEAALVAGGLRQPGDEVASVVKRFGAASIQAGYDRTEGGIFYEGPIGGKPDIRRKEWWAQAEAILAFWRLHRLTGEVEYWQMLEKTWDLIERRYRDPKYGEWFPEPVGWWPNREKTRKGWDWKTGYHNIRAMVFLSDWIREEGMGQSAATARATANPDC